MDMNYYSHETEFDALAADDRRVRVHIYFNINEEDVEVYEFSRLTFKKSHSIEMGPITSYYLDASGSYEPTSDDLTEWRYDMQRALQKTFGRLIA